MLHVSHDKPLTIAELIEVLRTLPQDLVCTRIVSEFEPESIVGTRITGRKIGGTKLRVSLVEIRLEPAA